MRSKDIIKNTEDKFIDWIFAIKGQTGYIPSLRDAFNAGTQTHWKELTRLYRIEKAARFIEEEGWTEVTRTYLYNMLRAEDGYGD